MHITLQYKVIYNNNPHPDCQARIVWKAGDVPGRDRQGRQAEAESLFRRALEIREKAPGRDHPKTKIVRDSLARLLRVMGAERTPPARDG